MTRLKTIHLFQLLWMAALALLIAIPFLRVTTRLTRFTAVILCFVVWFGFVALIWRRRTLRYSMLSVSVLIVVFLVLPGRSRSDTTEPGEENAGGKTAAVFAGGGHVPQ